jgi:multimeric flavodoxin WrbA
VKILGLSCSPRRGGNTEILLAEVLKGAEKEGAEVEFYSVSGKDIKPCDGCRACYKRGKCHIKDDMQDLYEKLLEADGIIFGTPIYFYSMIAQAKTIVDRSIALNTPERNLTNKIGGVVVVGGSLGIIDAVKDLYFYIITRRMLPANYVAAYASAKGDVKDMEECLSAARDLGRQMVLLALNKFKYPTEIPRAFFAYGTHTR